jgi:lysophospholipase L1-like esterase
MSNRRGFAGFLAAVTALAAGLAASSWAADGPGPDGVGAKMRIVLVGDSTVAEKSGWGPGFARHVGPDAECINMARGGRSSKSYRDEGLWKKALGEKPDYLLIQFGHNDQPGKGPERETDPETTYRQNMARYVDEARSVGARPILVTSLARRHFNDEGKIVSTLGPYVEAVKAVAKEKQVPLLDLHARSIEQLERLGPKASEVFDPKPDPDAPANGKPATVDKTHLSPRGSELTAELVVEELKKVEPSQAPYLK